MYTHRQGEIFQLINGVFSSAFLPIQNNMGMGEEILDIVPNTTQTACSIIWSESVVEIFCFAYKYHYMIFDLVNLSADEYY